MWRTEPVVWRASRESRRAWAMTPVARAETPPQNFSIGASCMLHWVRSNPPADSWDRPSCLSPATTCAAAVSCEQRSMLGARPNNAGVSDSGRLFISSCISGSPPPVGGVIEVPSSFSCRAKLVSSQCFFSSRNTSQLTPKIIYFDYRKQCFSRSKYPKNMLFNFEKGITVSSAQTLIDNYFWHVHIFFLAPVV